MERFYVLEAGECCSHLASVHAIASRSYRLLSILACWYNASFLHTKELLWLSVMNWGWYTFQVYIHQEESFWMINVTRVKQFFNNVILPELVGKFYSYSLESGSTPNLKWNHNLLLTLQVPCHSWLYQLVIGLNSGTANEVLDSVVTFVL